MYYALVHYLKDYPVEIDAFRLKYDPRVGIADPHLTLIFPIDASIDETQLVNHISTVLGKTKVFSAEFAGIAKSWDGLVFLGVNEGSQQVIKLHNELYTGLLQPFLSPNIEYIPHITLGKASLSSLEEARNLRISFSEKFDQVVLIKRENQMSPIIWSKVFRLK